jgi:hypothetical protein
MTIYVNEWTTEKGSREKTCPGNRGNVNGIFVEDQIDRIHFFWLVEAKGLTSIFKVKFDQLK